MIDRVGGLRPAPYIIINITVVTNNIMIYVTLETERLFFYVETARKRPAVNLDLTEISDNPLNPFTRGIIRPKQFSKNSTTFKFAFSVGYFFPVVRYGENCKNNICSNMLRNI